MYIPSIRPGRIASAIAAAVMTASLVAAPAYADSRVVATIGADLTPAQKQTGDCGGNLGPNPSYATKPKSLRYCMGLL